MTRSQWLDSTSPKTKSTLQPSRGVVPERSRKRLGLALKIAFSLAGLIFLAITFPRTWDRSRQHVLPSAWALGSAWVFAMVSLSLLAKSWVSLLAGHAPRPAVASGFYTAQLGKYLPGGVWQAVGQIGLAKRAGVTTPIAVTAFPVHAIVQATAGGTVGTALAVIGWGIPLPVRLASLAGVLLLPLLRRPWMLRVMSLLARLLRRSWPETLVPSQGRILRSYAYGLAAVGSSGAGFMLLASSLRAGVSMPALVPVFALAWTAGFLALPFPSGIGVREAVLIVVVGTAAAAPLIGASIAHRLMTMAAEVVMIGLAAVRERWTPDRDARAMRSEPS
jgi:hypothetical protein